MLRTKLTPLVAQPLATMLDIAIYKLFFLIIVEINQTIHVDVLSPASFGASDAPSSGSISVFVNIQSTSHTARHTLSVNGTSLGTLFIYKII